MINNPLYQGQNFHFHNSGNTFYQQHPYHQLYAQNSNHQMYYHLHPGFHQQHYHQNYYNYNRQYYPQYNIGGMLLNNQNYPYQYNYQYEPIQAHYSVHPIFSNNEIKPFSKSILKQNVDVKKNDEKNNKQINNSSSKNHLKVSIKVNDDNDAKENQIDKKKLNQTTLNTKKESDEKFTDMVLKNIEDTTVIKIGNKYEEAKETVKNSISEINTLEYIKPSNRKLNDSLSSSSSIDFNDFETSSEVFRQEENDSTTIVNHIEIKLENSVDHKPKPNKSKFNSTIEELKSNNLFLAQQKKVEQYELYEKVKNDEIQELQTKLRKEYKHNHLGERSNTKPRYRLFNHVNDVENTNIEKEERRSAFKINDDVINSNIGRIKFLGVYKADPGNYFRNFKKLTRKKQETSLDSKKSTETSFAKDEEGLEFLKHEPSKYKSEKYYKLIRDENGMMTLKEI